MEADAVAFVVELGEQDEGGGEGGVAAEVDLDGGGEPAQLEVLVVGVGDQEGGLGEGVLGGDRLEDGVGEPALEQAHGGRVAGEAGAGEGVDLVAGEGLRRHGGW